MFEGGKYVYSVTMLETSEEDAPYVAHPHIERF
jgi:hypothetical protein